jgi:hypothetical protein
MTPIPTTGTTAGWNVMVSVSGIQVFATSSNAERLLKALSKLLHQVSPSRQRSIYVPLGIKDAEKLGLDR